MKNDEGIVKCHPSVQTVQCVEQQATVRVPSTFRPTCRLRDNLARPFSAGPATTINVTGCLCGISTFQDVTNEYNACHKRRFETQLFEV